MAGGSRLIEPVYMVVLTGGPCSGKTSSMAYLTERLSDYGYMVFIIPETATLITNNGIDRRKMDRPRQVIMYEEAILDMQLAFEETYLRAVARIFPERKKVLLLDRGVMDIKAFMPSEEFDQMLRRKGLNEMTLRDRYHGIVHLVTAADGAREYYTGENNRARLETAEEAALIDERIKESWLGHPRLKIIDSRADFESKIRQAFSAISQILGMPESMETREKYLLEQVNYGDLPTHQIIEIEQVYLRSQDADEIVRIKKRSQGFSLLYFLGRTKKSGTSIEEEELITEQQYMNLMKLAKAGTEPLIKDRISFLWHGQRFELDRYKGRHEGLLLLNVERFRSTGQESGTELPPFITIKQKITNFARYTDRNLSLKMRKTH
ncbi:MAG TPA: ATP-binding protein [Syntrophorhabdaceae bacterium]|jgi:CYTH domain-containing protein/predicted ATPase